VSVAALVAISLALVVTATIQARVYTDQAILPP
jgi:hypothetical protein